MSTPVPDRRALEELWLNRLNDAKLRLDFAQNYMIEVQRDYSAGDMPESDHLFAHRNALLAETSALNAYRQVLQIYSDLTVRGMITNEAEWLSREAQARATANRSNDA